MVLNADKNEKITPVHTAQLNTPLPGIMSLVSMVGGLVAPPLRTVMGYRSLMVVSAFLHIAVYVGMIVLTEWAILLGSVITGI